MSTLTADDQRNPATDAEMQARVEQDADRIMTAITDPTAAFTALTRGIQVEEWDTSTLGKNLRDKFCAYYLERKNGTRIIVVPAGQDPVVRLHAVRALLAHPGVTA